ncbi:MAG: hypothetical protein A4E66_01437 [Syntrophus sp. PtaB.Bin001]|nr:MAG: hypothetical protein A4E66_01437 [Syntrophus sp. PtaB.Bin001]
MRRYLRKNKSLGFTLVELMISMLVGLIVLYASYDLFIMQNRTLSNQDQIVEMQQNARAAIDMLTREIRMAGYNPAAMTDTATKPQIKTATANSISFIADLNGDGTTTAGPANPNENIGYDVYNSSGISCLGRTSNNVKQPTVDHITSLNFTYVLDDGTITATPTAAQRATIAKINVSVTAQSAGVNPATGTNWTYTLTSEIVPRNM